MPASGVENHAQNRRRARAEELRAVAAELFLAEGYDATSMDRVAGAANVSKRTPYIYFANKHDLFSAVVLEFLEEIEARLDAIWAKSAADIPTLKRAMQAYADYMLRHPARFRLIMTFERRDFYPGREGVPSANAQACQNANDRITARAFAAVDAAIVADAIRTELSAKQFSLLAWSALTGVLTIAIERRKVLAAVYGWNAKRMISAFIEDFFRPYQQTDHPL